MALTGSSNDEREGRPDDVAIEGVMGEKREERGAGGIHDALCLFRRTITTTRPGTGGMKTRLAVDNDNSIHLSIFDTMTRRAEAWI